MNRHTLKILQHLLQDFWSVSDHFTTLRSKGLKMMRLVCTEKLTLLLQRNVGLLAGMNAWKIYENIMFCRSRPPLVFLETGVLKIWSNFTGEHPSRSVISIKLLEITLRHGFSPVNLLHIFRTTFPKDTFGGLLLVLVPKIAWKEQYPQSSF